VSVYMPARFDDDDAARIVELAALETGENVSKMLRKLVKEALAAREAPQAASPVTVPAEMVREAVRSPQPVVLPIHDGADPVQPSGAHLSAMPVEPAEVEPVVYSDEERAMVDPVFQVPGKAPVRSRKTTAQILEERKRARLGR
jgi:hypothetical protein